MFKILLLLLLAGCFKSFPITEEQSNTEVEITPMTTPKVSHVPEKETVNPSIVQSKNKTKMNYLPQTTHMPYNLSKKNENITVIVVLTARPNNTNEKHNLKTRSVEKEKLQNAAEVSEPCCGRANVNSFSDEGSQKEDRNCCGRLKPDNQAAFNGQPEDNKECCGRVEQNQQLSPVLPVKAKRSAKCTKNSKTQQTAVEPKIDHGFAEKV